MRTVGMQSNMTKAIDQYPYDPLPTRSSAHPILCPFSRRAPSMCTPPRSLSLWQQTVQRPGHRERDPSPRPPLLARAAARAGTATPASSASAPQTPLLTNADAEQVKHWKGTKSSARRGWSRRVSAMHARLRVSVPPTAMVEMIKGKRFDRECGGKVEAKGSPQGERGDRQ